MPLTNSRNLGAAENPGWLQRIVYRNQVQLRKKSPVPYPGRRLLARLLDWTIYYLIWNYISLVLLRGKIIRGLLLLYLDSMAVMLLMLLLEPLFLSILGTTAGKAVMGLKIRTDEGEKLALKDSFRRTFQVFADGMGFNILVFNLLNMVWARRNAAEGLALLWEQENSYQIEDAASWRIVTAVLTILLLLFYGLPPIYNQAQYPLYRGDISRAQYVENVNEMLWRSGEKSGFNLDSEGNWLDEEGKPAGDGVNLPPRHEIIEEDGQVVAVKLEIKIDVAGQINGGLDQKALVATAFAAASEEIKMKDLQTISSALGDIKEDYELVVQDLVLKSEVSYSGYRTDKNLLYGEEEIEDRYYFCQFTVFKQE